MENQPEVKSDINYRVRASGELLEVLRRFYKAEYAAILAELKAETPDLTKLEKIDDLFYYEDNALQKITGSLRAAAVRLELELSPEEARRVVARCYYALVDFQRQFDFDNLLEGLLAGYRIAKNISRGLSEGKFKIHEMYDPEGIIEIDGWIYGICIDAHSFRSLTRLRAPGVDSALYSFDGLNEDFYFTTLIADGEEERLLQILDNTD